MVHHTTINGAVAPSTFGNLIISWETANLLDVGVDFSLLDNRFLDL